MSQMNDSSVPNSDGRSSLGRSFSELSVGSIASAPGLSSGLQTPDQSEPQTPAFSPQLHSEKSPFEAAFSKASSIRSVTSSAPVDDSSCASFVSHSSVASTANTKPAPLTADEVAVMNAHYQKDLMTRSINTNAQSRADQILIDNGLGHLTSAYTQDCQRGDNLWQDR